MKMTSHALLGLLALAASYACFAAASYLVSSLSLSVNRLLTLAVFAAGLWLVGEFSITMAGSRHALLAARLLGSMPAQRSKGPIRIPYTTVRACLPRRRTEQPAADPVDSAVWNSAGLREMGLR